jgi:hypothetical protein
VDLHRDSRYESGSEKFALKQAHSVENWAAYELSASVLEGIEFVRYCNHLRQWMS